MNNIPVYISKEAEKDIRAIYKYITDELKMPLTAEKHLNAIADSIQSLELFLERCPLVQELRKLGIEVRCLLVKRYAVFYKFDKNIVTILRVLYQTSHLDNLINEIGKKQ